VRWLKVHSDGPDHAWEDDTETAVCGVEPDGELLPADGDLCFRCAMAHGTALADVQGDAAWRP
jgi:hypothetical protein